MKKIIRAKKQKILITLASIVGAIAVLFAGFGLYVNDYYRADLKAIAEYEEGVVVDEQTLDDGSLVYTKDGNKNGLIFYPGGKVEYTAYKPLMMECAEKGFTCILVKMPFNLAVLDKNAADGIQEQFPEIEKWVIGGHSLGAAMAGSYVAENAEDFCGLFLLAGYSTADLTNSGLKVLSMYGSEDKIMNMKKYEKYKANLPANFKEFVIEGGCHSYFGMYGMQDGDGEPSVTPKEQIEMTAKKIAVLVK